MNGHKIIKYKSVKHMYKNFNILISVIYKDNGIALF